MRRSLALFAALALNATGCRFFDPGLPDTYDGGGKRVRIPVPVWPDAGPDAAYVVDLIPDRRRDEPAPPGPPEDEGCADGTREGFVGRETWMNIAGCAGAWTVPGLLGPEVRIPSCGRGAGNDGSNTAGIGCNVSDLCAVGWHVCPDADEVRRASPSGCESAVQDGEPRFFLVLAGASPQGICSPDRTAQNDLHGCGTMGQSESPGCDPLNRRITFVECLASDGVWSCGDADRHLQEAALVTKSDATLGGVLCCKNN
jgi:hypothetical protein